SRSPCWTYRVRAIVTLELALGEPICRRRLCAARQAQGRQYRLNGASVQSPCGYLCDHLAGDRALEVGEDGERAGNVVDPLFVSPFDGFALESQDALENARIVDGVEQRALMLEE